MRINPGLMILVAALLPFSVASAHVEGGDCVIHKFESDITLNKDSSVDITEDLLVDCGSLPDKHGIFRILPTKAPRPAGQYNRTPVTLLSITDFSGKPHKYETLRALDTVTWKIGDPDVTISGLNEYRIKYTVENAVYSEPSVGRIDFVPPAFATIPPIPPRDIFYWNLNGNFWELEIEQYEATIHFPIDLKFTFDEGTGALKLFSGDLGSSANSFAQYEWTDGRTLRVVSTTPLAERQGISLYAMLPHGIVTLYQPNFFQRFGGYLWYFPLLVLALIAYRLWSQYGRDPKLRAPEVVQYQPPKNLRPLELGLLDTFGMMKNEFLSATIVDLAVRGYLKIKEIPKQGILGKKDWELTKTDEGKTDLKPFEEHMLWAVFGTGDTKRMSELKNKFYTSIPEIKKDVKKSLDETGVFDTSSKTGWIYLAVLTAVELVLFLLVAGVLLIGAKYIEIIPHGIIAFVLSGLILILFAILMPRRTLKGAQLKHELDGFKLYLTRAEKYRMQFYEKENIFEKYLPYAVAFGVTDKWIKAFKEMYGEQAAHYAPVWYAGATGRAFAIDSFTSQMNSLASDISSSLSSSPGGSGGGGGAGGGGGGGGGGSW